jgi:hypothetical protein
VGISRIRRECDYFFAAFFFLLFFFMAMVMILWVTCWWQAGGQLSVAIVCPWACLPYRTQDGTPPLSAQYGNRNNPYISVT